jgi:hypothetical protein
MRKDATMITPVERAKTGWEFDEEMRVELSVLGLWRISEWYDEQSLALSGTVGLVA